MQELYAQAVAQQIELNKDKGNWQGFDVDFCKAVAAAVLGDASKVSYTTATGKTRFTKLAAGESVYIACFVGCTYHCG